MYSSLSAAPFNSLMLSTDSSALSIASAAAAAARGLPVDLGVLGELAVTHAKQGTPMKESCYQYYNNSTVAINPYNAGARNVHCP